jgi:hypothetical protein
MNHLWDITWSGGGFTLRTTVRAASESEAVVEALRSQSSAFGFMNPWSNCPIVVTHLEGGE